MALQNYTPIRLPPTLDPVLRHELLKVDVFLRQLTAFGARVPSAPQGTPPASGSFDLLNFLYLPGRAGGQVSRQRVTFETKIIGADGTTPNPAQTGIGFTGYSATDSPTTVNLSMEETAMGRTKSPTREWIFPAFNRLDTGPTNGYHYFVDVSDYQQITNKLMDAGNYIALEDNSALGGLYNATWDKHLAIAWGGSFPAGGFNSGAGTLTTPTGTQPSLQIPSLDYKVQGSASARDRSHIWCVLKKDHTAAPFEPNSFLYGGATGKELYHMLAVGAGTIPATSNGFIPYFNNTLSLTVTFTLSSAVVNLDAGSTTGMRVGMRVRQTANSYSLPEDTFVQQVNSSTQFTMTQNWPGSTVSGQTINVFGPTWENVSAISGSITDVLDSLFRIVDNGDITKKLAFEVSGVTTATTRTWTVPNFDGTPALFRSDKLRIGDTTAPTHRLELVAGTTTVAPLLFTTGSFLTSPVNGTMEYLAATGLAFTVGGTRRKITPNISTATLASGRIPIIDSGFFSTDPNLTFLSAGGGVLTTGTIQATDLLLSSTKTIFSNIATTDDGISAVQIEQLQSVDGFFEALFAKMTVFGAGTISGNYFGLEGGVLAQYNGTITASNLIGLRATASIDEGDITGASNLVALSCEWASSSAYADTVDFGKTAIFSAFLNNGTITQHAILYVSAHVVGTATLGTGYQIYMEDNGSNWAIYSLGGPSALAGKLRVGSTTAPTNALDVTGSVTVSTLTSGRVTFAGASGLLSDDADLTFTGGDTLNATKLAISQGAVISGVYTPTLTNVANISASTAYQCQYMRVGNVVTVSGKVDVDPTTTLLSTQLGISLPIASNFGAEEDCGGSAAAKAIANQSAGILGDVANDRAQMEWIAGDVTNQPMYFSFTYRII